MAKILYEVKRNQNSYSQAYGKWYAQIKSLETLNTRKLANHISEHGSIYTPDVVYGVLEKFRSCLVEMLLESKKVKIEGLGTFYCTLENQKNGAAKKEDFNVNKHLKALHIRFLPEQTTEENISSREFLKKAEFINIDSLLKSDESENGDDSNGGDSGNGDSQNSGSQSGTGTINGGSGSGSQNSGSGSNTGGNSGSQSGNGESGVAGNYRLVIYKYGSGTTTVTDDSEQEINSNDNVASGSNVNISVVPAAGKVPTAKVNGNSITLTENDGTYTGSFVMPTKGTVLEVNSEPSDLDFGDGD
jgi:predicted histone-like DNA-binding protein